MTCLFVDVYFMQPLMAQEHLLHLKTLRTYIYRHFIRTSKKVIQVGIFSPTGNPSSLKWDKLLINMDDAAALIHSYIKIQTDIE